MTWHDMMKWYFPAQAASHGIVPALFSFCQRYIKDMWYVSTYHPIAAWVRKFERYGWSIPGWREILSKKHVPLDKQTSHEWIQVRSFCSHSTKIDMTPPWKTHEKNTMFPSFPRNPPRFPPRFFAPPLFEDVGAMGGIIAVSYEARAKGVTRQMSGHEAKKAPGLSITGDTTSSWMVFVKIHRWMMTGGTRILENHHINTLCDIYIYTTDVAIVIHVKYESYYAIIEEIGGKQDPWFWFI